MLSLCSLHSKPSPLPLLALHNRRRIHRGHIRDKDCRDKVPGANPRWRLIGSVFDSVNRRFRLQQFVSARILPDSEESRGSCTRVSIPTWVQCPCILTPTIATSLPCPRQRIVARLALQSR
jgi:hypothetical protein